MSAWEDLDNISSRGSVAKKPGSLGKLHQKRKETLSQFFTPAWLVKYIWETLRENGVFEEGKKYSLLDNSVGSGSMFRFANREMHELYGLDIDKYLVSQVNQSLEDKGFTLNILHGAIENARLGQFSVGIINPAFSIPIVSESLTPFLGITHYGKLGPNTSAMSHEYALAQALKACDVVAAIVPRSTSLKIGTIEEYKDRLLARIQLPRDTFVEENVKAVSTDLLFFGSVTRDKLIEIGYEENRFPKINGMGARDMSALTSPKIKIDQDGDAKSNIKTPVTGNNLVELRAAGKKIKCVFGCGITEAKVKNAIYRKKVFSTHNHRYPKATKYAGQFMLDLDVIVLQEKPLEALNELKRVIEEAGGRPLVQTQLTKTVQRLAKKHKRMTVPFSRTVYRKGTPEFKAIAKRMGFIVRGKATSIVGLNEWVKAKRTDAGFKVVTNKGSFNCDQEQFFHLFRLEEKAAQKEYWEEIYEPIEKSYPNEIRKIKKNVESMGLDKWLTWDFQIEDLCELAFRPEGAICAWEMALGKSRLGLALSLLNKGISLIVVKSRLIDEMQRELRKLNVNEEAFQVIECVADTQNLKKINFISYEKLRSQIHKNCEKRIYADLIKGKIDNVICDEGGLLSNENSQQTKAVWKIRAKKRYIFDGYPVPNYPRDMLSLAAWTFGEEKSYQPYSIKRGYIYKDLFTSGSMQPTGRNAFFEHFVTMIWATNEFLDKGEGAKREVPRIKTENVGKYRNWLAPIIKRRVQQEPAVSKDVKFPVPEFIPPIMVNWDRSHLELYVKTVEEFANWYKLEMEKKNKEGKSVNLTMILARLEACFKAANQPHLVKGFAKPLLERTSKQRELIKLIQKEVAEGRRPIVFARNPDVLRKISSDLDAIGITNLVFTGQEQIKKRTIRLNTDIRDGTKQVMLSSLGVTQDGLNLPELNTFIFYNRSWKAREEFQAIYRLLRAEQKSHVRGFFLMLEGSIDEYQGQLIQWKAWASETGLDYGDQKEEEDFKHFDSFIHEFINTVPYLKNQLGLRRSNIVKQEGNVYD